MIDREKFFGVIRPALFHGSLSADQVSGNGAILDAFEKKFPAGDSRHLAYMLATTYHETARTMQPIEEYGHGRGRPYGIRDSRTGQVYDGRGDVQLTWKHNYERAGAELGIDLVNQPSLALDAPVAASIMLLGMTEGWFTGKRLSDYFNHLKNDPVQARRIINGLDRAELVAVYHRVFIKALS